MIDLQRSVPDPASTMRALSDVMAQPDTQDVVDL